MQPLLHLLGLLLALPMVGWSIALIALESVIHTTRPLELLLDFLVAYVWGVPSLIVAAAALAAAGFVRRSRRAAAIVLIAVNVLSCAIALAILGPPPGIGEAVILLPSAVSVVLAVIVARRPQSV